MRGFSSFLPHLCIALQLTLLLAVILDVFNPLLGLLKGPVFLVLLAACVLCAVLTAVLLIRRQRREE